MDLSHLPAVNASLNGIAALLLIRGRVLARAGRVDAHRRTMLTAFGISSLFLALYLLHKASRGFESTTLHVQGVAKVAYLMMLASHVALAMAVPVLAILSDSPRARGTHRSPPAAGAHCVADLDVRVGNRRADLRAALPPQPDRVGRTLGLAPRAFSIVAFVANHEFIKGNWIRSRLFRP